jgi:hypothetical protein
VTPSPPSQGGTLEVIWLKRAPDWRPRCLMGGAVARSARSSRAERSRSATQSDSSPREAAGGTPLADPGRTECQRPNHATGAPGAARHSARGPGERPLRPAGGYQRLPGDGPPGQEGPLRRVLRGRLLADPVELPARGRDQRPIAHRGMVCPDPRRGRAAHPLQALADGPVLGAVAHAHVLARVSSHRLSGLRARASLRPRHPDVRAVAGGPAQGAGGGAGGRQPVRHDDLRRAPARAAHLVDLGQRGNHPVRHARCPHRTGIHLPAVQPVHQAQRPPDHPADPQHGPGQRYPGRRGVRGERFEAVHPGKRQRQRVFWARNGSR